MQNQRASNVKSKPSFENALKNAFESNSQLHNKPRNKYSANGNTVTTRNLDTRPRFSQPSVSEKPVCVKFDKNRTQQTKTNNVLYSRANNSRLKNSLIVPHQNNIQSVHRKHFLIPQGIKDTPNSFTTHHYNININNAEKTVATTKQQTCQKTNSPFKHPLNFSTRASSFQNNHQLWDESRAGFKYKVNNNHTHIIPGTHLQHVAKNIDSSAAETGMMHNTHVSTQEIKWNSEKSITKSKPMSSSTDRMMESALHTLKSWQQTSISSKTLVNNQKKPEPFINNYKPSQNANIHHAKTTISCPSSFNKNITRQNNLPFRNTIKLTSPTIATEKPVEKFIRYKGVDYKIIKSQLRETSNGAPCKVSNESCRPISKTSCNANKNSTECGKETTSVLSSRPSRQYFNKDGTSGFIYHGVAKSIELKSLLPVTTDTDPLHIDSGLFNAKTYNNLGLDTEDDNSKREVVVNPSMQQTNPKRKYKKRVNKTGFPKPKSKKKRVSITELVTDQTPSNDTNDGVHIDKLSSDCYKLNHLYVSNGIQSTINNDDRSPLSSNSQNILIGNCRKRTNITGVRHLTMGNNKSPYPESRNERFAVLRKCDTKPDISSTTSSRYYELSPITASNGLRSVKIKLIRLNKIDDFIDVQTYYKSRCRVCHVSGRKDKIRIHVEKNHPVFFQNYLAGIKRINQEKDVYLSLAKQVYMRLYKQDIENLIIKPTLLTITDESVEKAIRREHVKKFTISPITKHLLNRTFRVILRNETRREKVIKFVVRPTICRIFNEAIRRMRVKARIKSIEEQGEKESEKQRKQAIEIRIKIVLSIQCTECKMEYADTKQLRQHMIQYHHHDLQRHISNKEREFKRVRTSNIMQYYCFRE